MAADPRSPPGVRRLTHQKPEVSPRSAGITRGPRACSSVDRASATRTKWSGLASAAFEGSFEDLDTILTKGGDEYDLRALYDRYATERVGPIPDRYR
jgi:hypothetical protein